MIAGVVALVALTIHGAHYVAVKTSGDLNLRARRVASLLWPALVLVTLVSLWARFPSGQICLQTIADFLCSMSFPLRWA